MFDFSDGFIAQMSKDTVHNIRKIITKAYSMFSIAVNVKLQTRYKLSEAKMFLHHYNFNERLFNS